MNWIEVKPGNYPPKYSNVVFRYTGWNALENKEGIGMEVGYYMEGFRVDGKNYVINTVTHYVLLDPLP
ncbi:hypothetical protein LCGC14_2809470 [marine sediment metagenome]|uniref:Uncharacterized protein n=1 Tax=marine sediment metagenome TaxID=412755 RepID=A0A0F9BBK6_9ZZZZ